MRRYMAAAVLLPVLLLLACLKEPVDRIVTGDGENITGTLTALQEGTAVFESGVSVPVPGGAARVYLRNGASCRGTVAMNDGILTVRSPRGELEYPFGSVSAVVWGADHAESLLFDVHAGAGWQNTHLEADEGDFLSVMASGSVTLQTGTSGPSGIDEFSSTAALVPEATSGELVMRIGNTAGPLAVGDSWSGQVQGGGEIFLAVNYPDQREPEVEGFYTVSITLGDGVGRGSVAIYPAPE